MPWGLLTARGDTHLASVFRAGSLATCRMPDAGACGPRCVNTIQSSLDSMWGFTCPLRAPELVSVLWGPFNLPEPLLSAPHWHPQMNHMEVPTLCRDPLPPIVTWKRDEDGFWPFLQLSDAQAHFPLLPQYLSSLQRSPLLTQFPWKPATGGALAARRQVLHFQKSPLSQNRGPGSYIAPDSGVVQAPCSLWG